MFAMSDVIMPSVSEPFGISPRSHAKRSVLLANNRASEVLKHAVKVDFWDVDAMADAIYGLLHYKALSTMFKELGKDEVDNLKWDNSAAKVKNVYIDTMAKVMG